MSVTWTVEPFGGVPNLDQVEVADFEPAILAAMSAKRAEATAIRNVDAPPDFANTLAALEAAGSELRRLLPIFYLWSGNFSTPAFRAIKLRLAPQLSELHDAIFQDSALYARVLAVAEQELDSEQKRLCDEYLKSFRKAGAHLEQAGRDRVAAINQRLSTLYTLFSDNVLADEEAYVTWLSADQLGGLAQGWLDAAKAAAVELGRPDAWAVTNTRSSVEPFLAQSSERALRETVWRIFYNRGDNDDANDNKGHITEILSLRVERARLLGFETHAHFVLSDTMAGTPDRATDLMKRVWDAASARFRREVQAMQALADSDGDGVTIEPWDVRFYGARVRAIEHEFDASELQAHFELEQLREAMFWAVGVRYGWTFAPADVPLPHPDVRAWTVSNADGSPRGLFYFDPFARKGKRSGAWMSAWRVQEDGVLPIVTNNCNYQKGEPTLLTMDEAETLFHEFGHAMHGLASAVTYRSLAGTNVPRDFVEFPSQLNEHWVTTPELLERFARHHETGEALSPALLDKLDGASNADSGFMTMEFLASAVMDMELHLTTEPVDPAAFEKQTLARWNLPGEVIMRHRTPHFAHIFSGESYSAGYYSYLWADALVADAAEAFAETGFYDVELSAKLMTTILSVGNTVDAAQAFRDFRGRDPEVEPLLRDRGFL